MRRHEILKRNFCQLYLAKSISFLIGFFISFTLRLIGENGIRWFTFFNNLTKKYSLILIAIFKGRWFKIICKIKLRRIIMITINRLWFNFFNRLNKAKFATVRIILWVVHLPHIILLTNTYINNILLFKRLFYLNGYA